MNEYSRMAFADFECFGNFGQAASQTLQFQRGALIERKVSQSLTYCRLQFLVYGQLKGFYRPSVDELVRPVALRIQARIPSDSARSAGTVDTRVGDRTQQQFESISRQVVPVFSFEQSADTVVNYVFGCVAIGLQRARKGQGLGQGFPYPRAQRFLTRPFSLFHDTESSI